MDTDPDKLSCLSVSSSHEGHPMFNADDVLVMIITAVSKDLAGPILEQRPSTTPRSFGVKYD
ncbi:hypothetical protein [Halochromatium roseum]|uniref:hypothetical protein n=1 Tax=Halochromatium roseum TaxID=391920 RepID=UPI0019139EFD|nr:hypothetical protein [Halochromatium roseum]